MPSKRQRSSGTWEFVIKRKGLLEKPVAEGEEASIRKILAGAKPEGHQRPLNLHHQYALVMFFDLAIESAMRMREMYTLTLDQVDFKKRTIFLDKTKNGDKRQVPMTTVTSDLLYWHIEAEKDRIVKRRKLIFPWLAEADRNLSEVKMMAQVTSRLSRQFARIFEAAKCVDLTFHDLSVGARLNLTSSAR